MAKANHATMAKAHRPMMATAVVRATTTAATPTTGTTTTKDLGKLSIKSEKYSDAIQLLERARSIQKDALGENHPDTVCTQNYLELVRKEV
ncbi:unnamed protein product [Ectocarpus sp. 13 AM-2016]